MSKIILITGPQGSGKNILTDLMSYDHERMDFDDLKRKQQLGIARDFKSLDRVIIDQCYPDQNLSRIIEICRTMEIDAIFVSNNHSTVFEQNMFDITYNITAWFSNTPIINSIVESNLPQQKSHEHILNERIPPAPPEPIKVRSQEQCRAPEFPKDRQNKGE